MAERAPRVVVGFHGSAGSHDALHLGRLLARTLDVDLEVAVALPYEPLPLPVEAYDDALEEHFEGLFNAARRDLGEYPFTPRELRERSPARALTELAESDPVHVLVVGSAQHGEQGLASPGTVGERLLTGSPCPVAIAPRGYAAGEPEALDVIGVAYDGGPEAGEALALGKRLADGAGAALRVIAVVPKVVVQPSRIGHTARGYQRALNAHFEAALENAGSQIPATIDYELVRLEGPPAAILAEATQRLDLIVTGSRGYGPVRRALLGGTASELVRRAHCPVVVTPRP